MRTHLSEKPITEIRPAENAEKINNYLPFKPNGLWYSVDGDWERWCREGENDWIDGRLAYELALGAERILTLTTADAVRNFGECYGKRFHGINHPDWRRVCNEYDGIEIAPYQWDLRYELMWYYGWDCASGCLWRPRGARLTLVA